MKKTLLAAAAALLTTFTAANAAVMGFANTGGGTQGGGTSDLTAAAQSLGGAGGFTLDPGFSGRYFDFTFSGSGTFSTTADQISGYYFLRSFAAGDTIGAGTFTSHTSVLGDWDTILVNDQTAGVWGASHSGFLGFLGDAGHYGYLAYDFTRSGLLSTISFNNGAYESVAGQSITIPSAVPLPATGLLLVGALGGIAGLRRRKKS